MKALGSLDFRPLVRAAVASGLESAMVLFVSVSSISGEILAVAGALDDVEKPVITAAIATCIQGKGVLSRMLDGELFECGLGERGIRIGIAARRLFIVVVPSPELHGPPGAAENFRLQVERLVSDAHEDFSGAPPPVGSGGSSSGPAELPLVEWGVTVPRKPS